MSRPAIAFVDEQQGHDLACVLGWIASQAAELADLMDSSDPQGYQLAMEAQVRRIGAVADVAAQLCGGNAIRTVLPASVPPGCALRWLSIPPLDRLLGVDAA